MPEKKQEIRPLEQREDEMDRARMLGGQKTESRIEKKEGGIPGAGMAQQLFSGSQGGPAAMVLGRGRNLTRMLLGGGGKGASGIMAQPAALAMEAGKMAAKMAIKMAVRQMIMTLINISLPFLTVLAQIVGIIALLILLFYAAQTGLNIMSANYANIANIPQDFH